MKTEIELDMKFAKRQTDKDKLPLLHRSIKKNTVVKKKSQKSPKLLCKKISDENLKLGTVQKRPSYINPGDMKLLSPSKIKLQLFPLDERIRVGLEKDGRNPFLELTLSARKKILSVLTHLSSKWGSSSIAKGELMLFPFDAKMENLTIYKSWSSNDCGVTAGDVHSAVGSPEIFRLKYGWISSHTNSPTPLVRSPFENIGKELVSSITKGSTMESVELTTLSEPFNMNNKENDAPNEKHSSAEPVIHEEPCGGRELPQSSALFSDISNISFGALLSATSLPAIIKSKMEEPVPCITNGLTNESVKLTPLSEQLNLTVQTDQAVVNSEDLKLSQKEIEKDTSILKHVPPEPIRHEDARAGRELSQPSLLFSSELSNISIGGLLSQASLQGIFNSSTSAFTVESMDSFINQLKFPHASTNIDTPSSFLDGDDTCHPFRLSKPSPAKDLLSLGRSAFSNICSQDTASRPSLFFKSEANGQNDANECHAAQKPNAESMPITAGLCNDNSLGLSSIRWNDSLGPFDLPLPRQNYQR